MTPHDRPTRRTAAAANLPADAFNWALRLATRMTARSLNMPEPVLNDTGVFVFAHVAAAERRAVKTLCPHPAASGPRPPPPILTVQPLTNQRRTIMIDPSLFLRRALQIDAVFSGAAALMLVFGAGFFASLLNLPETFLRNAGLVLVAFTLGVGYLASRDMMSKAAVWAVIVINAIWTIDSIVLLASGWVSPNLLGQAFIVMQAIAVGVFAELEFIGLRKSASTVTAG